MLSRLGCDCGFPLALAALLYPFVDAAGAQAVCQRWRLSNKETERIRWLVENHAALMAAQTVQWSMLQPLLTAEGIDDLLKLTEAASPAGIEAVLHCRKLLEQPRDVLDPPPLLTGDDLLIHGIPSGPQYKTLLQRIRAAQLDGAIRNKAEALAMVEKRMRDEG